MVYKVYHKLIESEDVYVYRVQTEEQAASEHDERAWITTEEHLAQEMARVLNQVTKSLLEKHEKEIKSYNATLDSKDARIHSRNETIIQLREAMESARQSLSNRTHGNAQYEPDILEADSTLYRALNDTPDYDLFDKEVTG